MNIRELVAQERKLKSEIAHLQKHIELDGVTGKACADVARVIAKDKAALETICRDIAGRYWRL